MKITGYLTSNLLDDSFPLPLDRPFSFEAAKAAGVSKVNLARLVDHDLLARPLPGTYHDARLDDSILLRAQCLSIAVPKRAVICDRHAAWLHGATMVLAPNEHLAARPISVFMPSGRGRIRNGLCDSGERNFSGGDVVEVGGLQVTSLLRTTCDLGRVRSRYTALAAIDQMYRLGVERGAVIAEVDRFRGMRWVTHLRELAPLGDGRAESPPESILRLIWIDTGLPEPQLQIEVWENGVLIAVIDLGLEEIRYGSEYDGLEWHGSAQQRDHDRRRRDYLADRHGWSFDVFERGGLFGDDAHPESRLARGVALAQRRFTTLTSGLAVPSRHWG